MLYYIYTFIYYLFIYLIVSNGVYFGHCNVYLTKWIPLQYNDTKTTNNIRLVFQKNEGADDMSYTTSTIQTHHTSGAVYCFSTRLQTLTPMETHAGVAQVGLLALHYYSMVVKQ